MDNVQKHICAKIIVNNFNKLKRFGNAATFILRLNLVRGTNALSGNDV
jgi:hypothetical protein